MASTLSRKRDELIEDLEDQVAELKRELSSLRRSSAKRGAGLYDDVAEFAGELYNQFWRQGRGGTRSIARQARQAGGTVLDHPVATTVVGLALIGLLASMLVARK